MAAGNSYAGHLEKLEALVAPAGMILVEVFGAGFAPSEAWNTYPLPLAGHPGSARPGCQATDLDTVGRSTGDGLGRTMKASPGRARVRERRDAQSIFGLWGFWAPWS
jgi:hypothetical protein